jgi:hypothetical protein
VDLHAEQLLEILNETSVVEQTPTRPPTHQKVEIAVFVGFTASDGAKHTNVVSATPLCQAQDFVTPFCL